MRFPHSQPPPLNFSCGCDLTAECLPATEEVRVQLPATAPAFAPRTTVRQANPFTISDLRLTIFSQAARQLARPSLQNSVRSGQHRGGLPFSWGRGRQVMHLLCKQVDVGALPTDSTISLRGE